MKKALRKITDLLELKFGEDFSQYKTTTLWRRVEKRMSQHAFNNFFEYLEFLKSNDDELQELHDDFLIHVSHFFRDPEVFKFLEKEIIPKLIKERSGNNLRVWVPACSNGEEAYTIAILFLEAFEKLDLIPRLQIFATDISSKAIKFARKGEYQVNSVKNVPPRLLEKYFDQKEDRFTLKKTVKSKVLLAKQNIIQSPPFSKLDFLSCRNALIYFNKELQERAFDIFNYALKEKGLLLLGRSESTNNDKHFEPIHSEFKLFHLKNRKDDNFRIWNNPLKFDSKYLIDEKVTDSKDLEKEAQKIILDHFIPFSCIVNTSGDVLYFEGNAKRFFEFKTGMLSKNMLDLVKDDIKHALKKLFEILLHSNNNQTYSEAAFDKHGISKFKVSGKKLVKKFDQQECFLITIVDRKTLVSKTEKEIEVNHGESLATELKETREHLEKTIAELEEANDKLRDKAEEEQLMNEELQSANEELESSQEELQSLNEELMASNNELQNKIKQLTQSNNLLDNLIRSTKIPSLFLDGDLKVRRFTPSIKNLISLQDNDKGRSLRHFNLKFEDENFITKCEEVASKGQELKFELNADNGLFYWTQVIPYYNEMSEQDGIVINFYDVTKQKKQALELEDHRGDLEKLLKKKNRELVEKQAELSVITKNYPNGTIALIDSDRQIVYASGQYLRSANNMDGEVRNKPIKDVFGNKLNKLLKEPLKIALEGDRILKEVVLDKRVLLLTLHPVHDVKKNIDRVVLTFIDITEQKRLNVERERYAYALQRSLNEIYIFDAETLKFEFVNQGALENLGYSFGEMKSLTPLDLKEEYDKRSFEKLISPLKNKEEKQLYFETFHSRADKSKYPVDVFLQLIEDSAGDYFMAIINDSTNRRKAEESIRELENRMTTAVRITQLGYWEWDLETNKVSWSNEVYDVYDVPKTFTPTLENVFTFTHPDDRNEDFDNLELWIKDKTGSQVNYRIIRENGEIRYINSQIEVYNDYKGEPNKILGTILDVTEEKKREIALSNIANNTEERFVHVDLDMKIVNFNQQFKNEYSQFYDEEVKIGDSILKYAVSEDEKNSYLKEIYLKVFNGETIKKEIEVPIKNQTLTFQITYKPAKDEKNNIVGAFVSITNLTEIKQAQEKVKTEKEKLKLVAANFPSGSISLIDRNYNFLITGGEAYKQHNDDANNYIGKSIEDALPSEVCKQIKASVDKVFKGERIEEQFEYNNRIWFNTYIPLTDDDGNVKSVVMTSMDVTDREKARLALEASEERLELVVKGSQDAYWDYDIVKDEIFYSDSWFDMIGYEEDELGQRSELFFELMHPEDEPIARKTIQEAWNGGSEVYEIEVRLQHKSGNYKHILSRAYIERNHKGEPIRSAGTNFDLTEIREMESKLKQAKEEAERANSAKNIFLSNMTHEIKTPLNGIIGFSRLLNNETLSDTGKKYVSHINKSGKSLLDILNSILDFTRIEEGAKTLNNQAVNLNSLINSIRSAVLFQAQEKGLGLELTIEKNVPRYLELDETKLKQVLFNLLGNSIKFTTDGKVSLNVKLLKRGKENQVSLRFTVEDTGIGIARDEQEEIFKSFRQSNPSISSHYGGAGLGLTISQKLVHLMNSKLQLNSDLGEGSQFYFDLDVKTTNGNTDKEVIEEPKALNGTAANCSILILDDEETNVILAESIIQNHHESATLHTSTNPHEALELVSDKSPEIILLDLKMPQLNGFEFTKVVRQKKNLKQPIIIAITAGNRDEDYASCLEAGMDNYINKPIEEEELINAIEKGLKDYKKSLHFDEKSLKGKLSNSQDKVNRMISSIRPLINESVDILKEHLQLGEEENFKDHLHTIKGSSKNVGFIKLAKLAEELENKTFKQESEIVKGIEEIEEEISNINSILDEK